MKLSVAGIVVSSFTVNLSHPVRTGMLKVWIGRVIFTLQEYGLVKFFF